MIQVPFTLKYNKDLIPATVFPYKIVRSLWCASLAPIYCIHYIFPSYCLHRKAFYENALIVKLRKYQNKNIDTQTLDVSLGTEGNEFTNMLAFRIQRFLRIQITPLQM